LDVAAIHSYPAESYACASGPAADTCNAVSEAVASAAETASGRENYPSTPHLPFSPGVNPDDTRLADCGHIVRGEVVVTEKLDGGNCCIKGGQVYARTHAKPATHASFSAVKELLHGLAEDTGDLEIYGENMQAVHSIEYDNLASYFYVFSVRRAEQWLSWDEVVAVADRLGISTVPVLYRGHFQSTEHLQKCFETWAREHSAVGRSVTPEAFVVRRVEGFSHHTFAQHVAKYVRAGHIQTDDSWRRRWKKAQLGEAIQLSPREVEHARAAELRTKLANPRSRHTVIVSDLGEVELPRNFSFLLADVAVSSTPKNREQILALADMGIKLVVTLTEETPLPQEWFVHSGVRNLFVPVPNYHPPTVAQTDAALAAIAGTVEGGGKAMVHCGGGKGRAGTIAACLILRYGNSSVAAAVREERAGGTSLSPLQSSEVLAHLRDQRPESVETERQERFIREYASILWRMVTEGSAPDAGSAKVDSDAVPEEAVAPAAKECNMVLAEVDEDPLGLPPDFADWLRGAVREELSEADAEGILAAVEVICSGACEEPDAIASAQEVLSEGGAPRCAEELELRWAAVVAKA